MTGNFRSVGIGKALLFLTLVGLFACKAEDSVFDTFDQNPYGIFWASGTLVSVVSDGDTLTYDYRSGELDTDGFTINASTSYDYVNLQPYKAIVGRLDYPVVEIFSLQVTSLTEVSAGFGTEWTAEEIDELLFLDDTLRIGYGPGQAILGIHHPAFNYNAGTFKTRPEENEAGITGSPEGWVVITKREPYSVTHNGQSRSGLRLWCTYQGRLNGQFGQPDYIARGDACLFFEYPR